jgi:hypothetical protein
VRGMGSDLDGNERLLVFWVRRWSAFLETQQVSARGSSIPA